MDVDRWAWVKKPRCGLKQAPRAWLSDLLQLLKLLFYSWLSCLGLFVHISKHGHTLLLLYMDDMLIVGDDNECIAFVKAHLKMSNS